MRVSHHHRRQRGIAIMEFALALPLLALLLLIAVDLSRAIQARTILLNISREGANLASRSTADLHGSSQTIMNALAATTPPLDMRARGMVYITKIAGYAAKASDPVRNVVLEQYRWNDGVQSSGYAPRSQVWHCNNWNNDGACSKIPAGEMAPDAPLMQGQLARGELIYAVETFYRFDMLFGALAPGGANGPALGPDLYSMTVF
ncbi:TadE/TadG family type IV pilus assembly protein [Janthinobacterium aquaticum]|uniref:TadE/TadG family type IV pilus assembly protein n=1 Tax=Janthinobacterium sp. FT58W TaxID=2654254 RepID=UPI001264FB15|nr:TadE/TadG family type IV pilus assembly protein [Janthinobacterium sp. FT58W]KAB8042821.1 pilus assembly protein [Janthinobacterium sp. FT58W]